MGESADARQKRLAAEIEYSAPVYRFFLNKEHAEDLVKGNVYISTLEECRKHEDPMRGDKEEGKLTWRLPGKIVGGSQDKDFVAIAARGGVFIGLGCSDVSIENMTTNYKLPDAFVICATNSYDPASLGENFGRSCVEISDPIVFLHKVTKALDERFPFESAHAGNVTYRDQVFYGVDEPPGVLGFVKRPDVYAYQKEFRFLWIPKDVSGIKPFLLACPEIVGLCRLVG